MQIIDIQKQLKKINKSYYTISDLGQILKQKRSTLRATVQRLVQKDILQRIQRGVYILPDNYIKIEQTINQLHFPSYQSFETALANYGILNQKPYAYTYAWPRKSKKFYVGNYLVEIKHIRKDLFFGYTLIKDLYIASPEKALLDQLYFVSLGKAKLDWDELNLHELSKTKFLKWSKKFPGPAQKQAQALSKHFGKISITIK